MSTTTNEINKFRDDAAAAGDLESVVLCDRALGTYPAHETDDYMEAGRVVGYVSRDDARKMVQSMIDDAKAQG